MALQRLKWADWVKGGYIPFGERLAVLNLPTGKHFSYVPRLVDTTEADLIGRGFPYFFSVAAGSNDPAHRVVLFESVAIRAYAFQYLNGKEALQWTQDEVNSFIGSLYPYGIITDSLDEGYGIYEKYVFPTGSTQRAWADTALAALARRVTPNSILIASYADKFLDGQRQFLEGSTPKNPNTQANRNSLSTQEAARAGIPFYSHDSSNIARANMSIYPGTGLFAVNGNWTNYIIAYNMLRLTKASGPALPATGFTWCSPEGGGYTGDFAWRHELKNGTLWQNDDTLWSHNKCFHATMATLIFGGGNILWDRPDRFLDDPEKVNYRPTPGDGVDVGDVWSSPNGSPAPARSTPRAYPGRPQTTSDAHLSAAMDFGTMAQAAGTNFRPLRYRVKRGANYGGWYEVPSDVPNAAILEQAQDFRAIVQGAVTGNDIAIYAQDPSNSIAGERIQVDLGNNTFVDFNLYGQEPVRIKGSINANATQTLNR